MAAPGRSEPSLVTFLVIAILAVVVLSFLLAAAWPEDISRSTKDTLRGYWRAIVARWRKILFWAGLVLFAFVLFLRFVIGDAWSHDHGEGAWINHERLTDPLTGEWCCNLQDCRLENENVQPVSGGFHIISTGEIIPQARVIWRSPAGWWRCRYLSGSEAGKTRCLIGPPQSY